ncbi:MAG TPA: hypothetical protein VGH83_01115 [Candidatus Acidoferrum sp.]|jgi:hypothetical protein
MPDAFALAGAAVSPSAAAPLHTNEFFTGLWTQGNPLGPGAVSHTMKAYARYDRLVGGLNIEISTRLTPVRRPGSSVYNAGPFPPINRFFEFRGFSANAETIRILASCDPATGSQQGTVRDVTGPTTNLILWTKDKNAGPTSFVSVGNLLYLGDGIDTKILVQSNKSWGVGTGASLAIGTITAVQLYRVRVAPPPSAIQTIAVFTLTAPPAITLIDGQKVSMAGLTLLPLLNGKTSSWLSSYSTFVPVASNQIALNVSGLGYVSPMPNTAETGTLTAPGGAFSAGDFIVDSNGNVEEAVGAQIANITNIQIDAYTVGGSPGRLVTLFFSPATPLNLSSGVHLHLLGLTTVPGLNISFNPVTTVESSVQVQFALAGTALPVTAYSTETGTADTGSGVSAAMQPTWQTTPGAVTIDNGQQWVNKGSAIEDWGFGAPASAPTVTQSAAPSLYQHWTAATWYAPLFIVLDSNGNLQQLTTGGTTGAVVPVWNVTVGGTTADNTAVWTNLGPSAWITAHAYAIGAAILATYKYWITVPVTTYTWNGYTLVPTVTLQQVQITVTSLFQCIAAGTSGANQPAWINGLNTVTQDNGVGWKNLGTAASWATIGATQLVSTATTILDANGFLEKPQLLAKTGPGPAEPTWKAKGAITQDNTMQWLNSGPYTPAGTGALLYAFSGKSSVTGHVGNASPVSQPTVLSVGNLPIVQGVGVPNPPEDRLIVWRTLPGGSTLFYLDEIPNPGAGQPWVYTDTNTDVNELIQAPIAGENSPPPIGFIPQAYYLGRIWGYVGNILRWSGGPDSLTGSGDQSFPSKNNFNFPSLGVTCWPTSIGLICYTNSDIWAVLGQGTDQSPFYVVNFQQGVGLANQDALAINGSTAYGMLTSAQVVSMDPGAGELEVGFPIGDRFSALYTPSRTYCAWHQASSGDMALYVADGSTGWFRMAAVAAPESGNVWSPFGAIVGGVKAIASVEIVPGLKVLLLGPSQQGQPILMRDSSTNADNAQPYAAFADIGSLVLAQPGTTVGLQFIVTEEKKIPDASPVGVGVLLDEIAGSFLNLRNTSPDPPNLKPSLTVNVQRFWLAQDANTVQRCRHMQQRISWAAENFPNELYTNTIFGRVPERARK